MSAAVAASHHSTNSTQTQFALDDEPRQAAQAQPPAGAPHYSPQVWKHNRLVEARYQLNTRASKIFALSVAKLRGRKAASLSVEFTVEEFAQLCDVNKHALYAELYELTKSLMQNQPVISIPLPPEEARKRSKRGKNDPFTHVMLWPKISYKGEGVIEVHFHEDLRPYLLELTREFTRYDLLNVMRLSSTHTIRLYELLKEQLFRGEWKVEYDDLKELLGIKPEQYPSMGNFRQRILVPAQKEIHKLTDIHFHYKMLKTGRKYTAIRFYISSHPAPHQQPAPVEVQAETVPAASGSSPSPADPDESRQDVATARQEQETLLAKYRTGTGDTDYHGRWDAQQLIQYFRKSVAHSNPKADIPEPLVEMASNRLRDFPALREGYFEVIDTLVTRRLQPDLESFLREDILVRVLDRQWDWLKTRLGSTDGAEPRSSPEEMTIDPQLVSAAARVLEKHSPTSAKGRQALAGLHPAVNTIFDAWDNACPWGATKSRSQKRLDRFARRLIESDTFREHWQEAVANAGKSRFMRGENSRNQKFGINSLLNEEFLEKLVEGEFS